MIYLKNLKQLLIKKVVIFALEMKASANNKTPEFYPLGTNHYEQFGAVSQALSMHVIKFQNEITLYMVFCNLKNL